MIILAPLVTGWTPSCKPSSEYGRIQSTGQPLSAGGLHNVIRAALQGFKLSYIIFRNSAVPFTRMEASRHARNLRCYRERPIERHLSSAGDIDTMAKKGELTIQDAVEFLIPVRNMQ